jgi:hypothetical protein
MKTHWIEQEFAVPAARLWQVLLFDRAYQQQLYDHLRLKIESLEIEEEGAGEALKVRRQLRFLANRNPSGVIAKLLKGASMVKQDEVFDQRAGTMRIKIELPVIGKRVEMTGEYTWEPTGNGGCRRRWLGSYQAKIPLVGGQIEAYLIKETEQSMAESYQFTARYLRENPGP